MKKGLVSQETDQSFSITGRNPHEEPSNQPLKFAPHEERPSTSLITHKNLVRKFFVISKVSAKCIGTENIFISPRLFFQDGRVPRRIFYEERIVIAFVIPGKPLSKKKIQY